jgi:hypothetical protein
MKDIPCTANSVEDSVNVVISSLNWGSASNDPDFHVHVQVSGIGESFYQRLVASLPNLRE